MSDIDNLEPLAQYLQAGKRQRRLKKQIIQTTEESSNFYLVKSGYVKRYMISNLGSISTQVIYGPGDYFSITEVYNELFDRKVHDGPEVYYYEAMTDVEVYSVSIAMLVQEAETNPRLFRDFLCVAGDRLGSTLHGLENLGLKSAYSRVAHEILFLAGQFGYEKGGDTRLRVPLTHQDLADILSLTRETVSVSVGDLRKKRLIKTGKYIAVPDMKKLESEAFS